MASPTSKRIATAAGVGTVSGLLSAVFLGGQPEPLAMLDHAYRLPGMGLGAFLLLDALFGVLLLILLGKSIRSSYASLAMTGLVFGLFWWLLIYAVTLPVIMGTNPQWHVQEAERLFPGLVVHLFLGLAVGLGIPFLVHRLGLAGQTHETNGERPIRRRIVVLGGGFAGVTAVQRLEHLFRDDAETEIVLVSDTNYLLFTPMLSEVVGGSVEPQHISTSIRSFFRRARVLRAQVQHIDLEKRFLQMAPGVSLPPSTLTYDHLVVALGTVPHLVDEGSITRHAFTFKRLEDAVHLRNHLIERLERAEATSDPDQQRQMLTFVVAGGGFAGAELIGALNDFVHGVLSFYPNISPDSVSMILVHSRNRILPELSPNLAEFAQRKLEERRVVIKLDTRVTAAESGHVQLSTGEKILTQTLVWTVGSRAHPVLDGLGLPTDQRGRIQTDETLAVVGHKELWAVGDCAATPNRATGEMTPPTAQHATRAAAVLAHNVHASICGKPLKPFAYRSVGTLTVLGHQTACAEIYGVRFAGMLAWWMWRAIYLGKLPTLQKKIQVILDWLVALFFPRDVVEMGISSPHHTTETAPDSAAGRSRPLSTELLEP